MNTVRKRRIFNLIGGGAVLLWLIMIGILIGKNSVQSSADSPEIMTRGKVSSATSPRNHWMEIFLGGQKIGYSSTKTTPLADGFLIEEEIVLNLNLMGQASAARTRARSLVDRDFLLKSFTLRVDSGVVGFRISGKVEGERLTVETGEGKDRKVHVLQLSGAPVSASGMTAFFRGRQLKVGESFPFLLFDPSTLARKRVVVRVAAKEAITIRGMTHPAYRLRTEVWGQDLQIWLDESGEVLKEEGFMGLTLVRSSAANATTGLGGGKTRDFYGMASIEVKPKLQNPRAIVSLRLKVEGLGDTGFDTEILNHGRQGFKKGILKISMEKTPLKPAYRIPFHDRLGKMDPFLGPGFNIQSDDRLIGEKAREIVGNLKDPVAAAKRLLRWVYENLEKKPVISIPSAVEVLRTRVGDCNEHAILLTALLRAVGIPARECVGLVYARGRFFYHAWTEAYTDGWVSMDATLNQMPTDATHIKLVQGGLEKQTRIIALLGKLRLKVIDYSHGVPDNDFGKTRGKNRSKSYLLYIVDDSDR